jgi:hypothetical protein
MGRIRVEEAAVEQVAVESWRLHVLIEAGYPTALAEELAAAVRQVDLHQAVELVDEGCAHELAAQILL